MTASQPTSDVPPGPADARSIRSAAADLRDAVHELAVTSAARRPETEALDDATALVRAATARLQTSPTTAPSPDRGDRVASVAYRTRSLFQGDHNPLSHHLDWVPDAIGPDGQPALAFEVRVSAAFEGPPGAVHGGYVSGLFDELLGSVQARTTDGGGFTGRLQVRYRQPVPLATPVRFEGWVVADRGRRIQVAGRCVREDRVLCDAKALFVRPRAGTNIGAS